METKTYKVNIKGDRTHPPFEAKLKVSKEGKLISSKKIQLEADFDCIVFTNTMHALEDVYGGDSYHISDRAYKEIPFRIRTASGLTTLERAFACAAHISSIDLSLFDTSSVTNMNAMFGSCQSVRSLDLSHFDTSHVTDMGWLFGDCIKLEFVDVSSFDTSNVVTMEEMFHRAFLDDSVRPVDLDLRNFDVSKVENMFGMFNSCIKLKTLDITGWDTSKVQDFSSMFYGCESLQEIKGVIDMSSATRYDNMFDYYSARALKIKVKLKNVPKDFFSDSNNARARDMIEIIE